MNKMLISTLKVTVIFLSSGFLAYMVIKAQMKHQKNEKRVDTQYESQESHPSEALASENEVNLSSSKSEVVALTDNQEEEALYFDTSKSGPVDFTGDKTVLIDPKKEKDVYLPSSKAAPLDLSGENFLDNSKVFLDYSAKNNDKTNSQEKDNRKEYFHSSKVLIFSPIDLEEKKEEKEKQYFHSSKAAITNIMLEDTNGEKKKENKKPLDAALSSNQYENMKTLMEEVVKLRRQLAEKDAEIKALKQKLSK